MKNNKLFFKSMLLAAAMLAMTSCSNDEPTPNPDAPTQSAGFFVLNQGNYYSGIEGSLTYVDYTNGNATQNVFINANGRSLGNTPQCAIVYGSRIYIGVQESNVIEVINKNTFKSEKQIKIDPDKGHPRSVVAKGGKVYFSMYDGYVSRLDTLSLAIDATVEVGPNPDVMAIKGDNLYVPNSGGLNYLNGYNNTASKINLKTFTVDKTFEVPVNPTAFYCDGSNLFMLSSGNYADIASTLYRVKDDDKLEKVDEATMAACHNGKLYYINAPYYFTTDQFTYKVYTASTDEISDMLASDGVEWPCGIAIDPIRNNIIICSYNLNAGYADYSGDGYVKAYDLQGTFKARYAAGVGPQFVFFNME